jgi:type II secretory pathway component PulF
MTIAKTQSKIYGIINLIFCVAMGLLLAFTPALVKLYKDLGVSDFPLISQWVMDASNLFYDLAGLVFLFIHSELLVRIFYFL